MLGFEEKDRKYCRYIFARNYLTLLPEVTVGQGSVVTYAARWYVEGETSEPYTKRIHPPGSWHSSAREFDQAEGYSTAGFMQRCCFACLGGSSGGGKVGPQDNACGGSQTGLN
eukprot:Opistho-2@86181